MPYQDFTIKELKSKFGIRIKENDALFSETETYDISDFLSEALRYGLPLARAIGTDKAKSEFIIAPILAEIRKILKNKISLFSGIHFNVNPEKRLEGICDFIMGYSEQQLDLVTPVMTVVAAKNENINAGIPECMAQMIAARVFNEAESNGIKYVFGCVTTGTVWKFLKYSKGVIFVDADDYYIREADKILGIFLEVMALFIFRLTVFPYHTVWEGRRYKFRQLERILEHRGTDKQIVNSESCSSQKPQAG